ncbi:hypothetical protein IJZ97_01485 [bacterium]|nr:hypothetical protein [bacterium]
MLQKKFKEKYNDGCIKIFKLLQLLYENKAEYDDVMAIFSGDEPDAEKQHVTLNKFLNTLKVFGMKVQKTNKKFVTQNMPFSLKFDVDDLKSINIFSEITKQLPSGKTKINLEEFIQFMESRFDSNALLLFNNIKSNDNTDYTFYYSNLREQIEQCEKLCQIGFKIRLVYLYNGEKVSTYCNTKQVIYDNKKAYLRIFKINEKEVEDIPVTDIISYEQLPTQKSEVDTGKTVIFRLKGRLAKAYNLKENEYIGEYGEDGSIVVVNKNEPIDALLQRLMRYDYDCIIERPATVRNKMIQFINDTLKNYE